MAEQDKDSKTETASSKRVRETEEKGQFANSKELTSMFLLMAAILAFFTIGGQATQRMMQSWTFIFSESHAMRLTPEELFLLLKWVANQTMRIMGPILLSLMVAGIVANLIQTRGIKISLQPLKPNFGKFNPIKGIGRLFSKNSLVELLKSLFKIGVLGLIGFVTIKSRFDQIPGLGGLSVGQTLSFIGDVSLEIMLKALLFMMVLALVDYAFQIFQHAESIKMTKQEVKQERKETEGDPQIKQRTRNVQLEMAKRRMMAAVPEADVVVTNPTHIAVALKYDREKYNAPLVVAKGMGHVAAKIREIAREHGIPLVEDKPLARTLNQTVEVGQLVPASLYKAIAEILAYVYQLKKKTTV
ncbi:MAG: flagellar biosynthesis protein FlhB [Nitrospinales bacterium]